MPAPRITFGRFREGAEAGVEWDVTIIESGFSLNVLKDVGRFYYPADTLREAVPLFEGCKVFAYEWGGNGVHLPDGALHDKGGPIRNLVGTIDGVFVEDLGGGEVALRGKMHLFESATWLREKLIEAKAAGLLDDGTIGLSIDAAGPAMAGIVDGERAVIAKAITHVNSTDVVTKPAAGGSLDRLVASVDGVVLGGPPDSTSPPRSDRHGAFNMNESLRKLIESLCRAGTTVPDGATLEAALGIAKDGLDDAKFAEASKVARFRESHPSLDVVRARLNSAIEMCKAGNTPGCLEQIAYAAAALDEPVAAAPVAAAAGTSGGTTMQMTEAQRIELDGLRAARAEADKLTAALRETAAKAENQRRLTESAVVVADRVARCGLPKPERDAIAARFDGRFVEAAEVETEIEGARKRLAALSEEGFVVGLGGTGASAGRTGQERVFREAVLATGYKPEAHEADAFRGLRPFGGGARRWFRELYGADIAEVESGVPHAVTRYREAAARLGEIMRFTETTVLGTGVGTFESAIGAVTRRQLLPMWKMWLERNSTLFNTLAEVGTADDFKANVYIRHGGMSALPAVAPAAAYTDIFDATTEEAPSISVTKRGGFIQIAREAVYNDDTGVIGHLPKNISDLCAAVLEQFVADLFLSYTAAINDTNIYDATALYTVGHGNLGTAALTYGALNTRINAMLAAVEPDSSRPIANIPAHLIVPIALRATAMQLVTSERVPGSADNDINAVRSYFSGPEAVVVSPFLRADTNNWYLARSKADGAGIRMNFLEGRTEPQVLTQDGELYGTVFTNDAIRLKVRHEYSGAVTDFRAYDGNLVT